MDLPQTVTWNGKEWTLHVEVLEDGNTLVEYVYSDDAFPVAFSNETFEEAKAYMLDWLQDNGLI